MTRFTRPAAACLLALSTIVSLTGCYAERPIVQPVDPEWSYHQNDLANSNDANWTAWIDNAPANDGRTAAVRSVEDPTP